MNWKAVVAGLAVLAVLVWGVNQFMAASEWKETAREFEKEAETARDSVEFYRKAADSAQAHADSAQKAAQEARKRAEERVEAAERQERQAEKAVDSLKTAFTAAIPDSIPRDSLVIAARRVFEAQKRQIAALTAQIRQKDDIIAVQDTVMDALEAEIAAKDGLIEQLEAERDEWRSQAQYWKEEARPAPFSFSLGSAPKDIALLLAGYGLGKAF